MEDNSKITFIIPTIGRDTLHNTVNCLLNQTNPNWNAIIVFDGIEPNFTTEDKRIIIIQSPKLGENFNGYNGAGSVRNFGIQRATTEWIAFVDDDDGIKYNYVEVFLNEITEYDNDLVIFRMKMWNGVLPPQNTDNFYDCQVGISFAVKKHILDSGILFDTSQFEDYYFLNSVRELQYKIMISPYLLYFVRSYDVDSDETMSNRVFINN